VPPRAPPTFKELCPEVSLIKPKHRSACSFDFDSTGANSIPDQTSRSWARAFHAKHLETWPSHECYESPNRKSPWCDLPNLSDGSDAMKKHFLILIATLALVMIQGFSGVSADSGGGIPLAKLAGKFAQALDGVYNFVFQARLFRH
jgi:hypothetical protein